MSSVLITATEFFASTLGGCVFVMIIGTAFMITPGVTEVNLPLGYALLISFLFGQAGLFLIQDAIEKNGD